MTVQQNNSLRLLILCQLFYPELVSTGQTLTELCEQLVDLGMELEVVCARPSVIDIKKQPPNLMKYHGITIRRVWGTSFPKLNFLGRVINQITYALSVFVYLLFDRTKRPILVLTNPPFLAFFCAILRKIKLGNPYIYLIFDIYPDTAVNLGVLKQKGFLSLLWEWINKVSFKHAARIVVIGRCMQKKIEDKIRKYDLNITDKIRMIHVWSDDKLIRNCSDRKSFFIKQWGLENKFIVLYSGNMGRFHDMETIMYVVKKLSDNKDIMFVFVGEGYKKKWMMKFAQDNSLQNCVFHTYVPREKLPDLLSCANIGLVSLMKGQEGLSVPSKTYGLMAAGLPVVAIMSSFCEIAQMIREENCGMVIKPGDVEGLKKAILTFFNSREKLDIMGRNARKAIDNKYNIKQAALAYYELIKEIDQQI